MESVNISSLICHCSGTKNSSIWIDGYLVGLLHLHQMILLIQQLAPSSCPSSVIACLYSSCRLQQLYGLHESKSASVHSNIYIYKQIEPIELETTQISLRFTRGDDMGFQTAIGRGQITAVSHATDQPNIPTTTKVKRGAWMTLGDHGLILQVSHSDLEQLMAPSTLQQAKREAISMWPAEKP